MSTGKQDKAGQRVNIWTNFRDYGLPAPLGLLRADLHRHPFRRAAGTAGGAAGAAAAPAVEGILDAIVCDPPYGVSHHFLPLFQNARRCRAHRC